jgi:hypothetical protein
MTTKSCSRCKLDLAPVRMLDATRADAWSLSPAGSGNVDQRYAAADADPSFWTRSIPAAGVVRGFICPKCGRITLYGEPLE